MESSLTTARDRLSFLDPVGAFNNQLQGTLIELEAARDLAQSAGQMLKGLEPTLFFLVSGDDKELVLGYQISSGERLVELLQIGRGQFVQAGTFLNSARQQIDRLNLSQMSPDLILRANDLDTITNSFCASITSCWRRQTF